MKYSEIFESIQGEGQFVGVPSVFLRTSFCDLRCHFCDTPYTSWTPENKHIDVVTAYEQIRQFKSKHVVITGGEPMLWGNEITALSNMLRAEGYHITIETNGRHFHRLRCDLMSISPKLSSSTPKDHPRWAKLHNQLRLDFDALERLLLMYPCQFKFVVEHEADFDEVELIIKKVGIRISRVYLMAQGRTRDEIRERADWIVPYCIDRGFHYSPRVQVDIWGDVRGT